MAKQKGVLKLEGEIGDISFYKTQDGYLAREKSAISGARIKTDPAFTRTRENNAEFGRAGGAGRLLRESLMPVTASISDGRVSSRLNKAMMAVVKSDPVSDRGMRNVIEGNLELLTKFQFNDKLPLEQAISARMVATFNRTTGAGTVTIDPFVPRVLISAPTEASHYTLVLGISACNFETETYNNHVFRTQELELLNTLVTLPPLVASLPAATTGAVFLALGIELLQEVNNKMYPLKSAAYNAAALVLVDAE